MKYLERRFQLREAGTSIRTEIVAGMTTFMTMAYILVVNPMILSAAGMDFPKVFAATAIASALATMAMGFLANLPIGLSAGMGLNAFFAYTVCLRMGYSCLSVRAVHGLHLQHLRRDYVRHTVLCADQPVCGQKPKVQSYDLGDLRAVPAQNCGGGDHPLIIPGKKPWDGKAPSLRTTRENNRQRNE